MWKNIFIFIALSVFSSCDKEPNEVTSQREYVYENFFIENIGKPNSNQDWGDWTLSMPNTTRGLINDTTEWSRFLNVVYPSADDIRYIKSVFRKYYGGINEINVPSGDYWVKVLDKNDVFYYTNKEFTIRWFLSYEKMPNVSFYNQEAKKYEIIDNVDSLALIEQLDGYDGVMPQFAYFNDLYGENHYEQRIIEYNGIYYVGFDFYADGLLQTDQDNYKIIEERDYIYNDIILMLIPAYRYGNEKVYDEKRVLCEDLSLSPDFDFNDLVYDVAIVDLFGSIKTRITIQAVGTKASINICGREAHSLFGVSNGVYVNTSYDIDEGILSKPVSIYLDGAITDIRDLDVMVFYDNKVYSLNNDKGKVTERICVDTKTKWGCEEMGLWVIYPEFKHYVTDNFKDWEKNVRKELTFK